MSILSLIKILAILIFGAIFFENIDTIIYSGYSLSKMYISFIIIFTIITKIKYYILKQNIEKNNKNQFIKSIIIIVLFFTIINLIYAIVPQYYQINNWYYTVYKTSEEQLIDFLFIPVYNDAINILKMTLLESIFSLILAYIAYLRAKKQTGKLAYTLERILKNSFRYSFVIIFFIYLFTVPNKYLLVKEWKEFGIALLCIGTLVVTIKNYLAVKSCSNKNKSKLGKENLVIILTQTNYKFCLSDYIINPLHIFKQFDTKNLVKPLLVDGKKYSFILYDAIRYKLIDINQYKNKAYLIITNGYLSSETKNNGKSEYEIKVQQISKTENFLIYNIPSYFFVPRLEERIKEEYTFRYTEKIDVKKILDILTITKDTDKLKLKSKKMLEYIKNKELENFVISNSEKNLSEEKVKELTNKMKAKLKILPESNEEEKEIRNLYKNINQEKNTYIKYGLNLILSSFNYIEYFYTLLKMCEYVTHYMALKNIIDNPSSVSGKDVRAGTLSAWRNCINFDKSYNIKNNEKIDGIASEKDLINSIIKIKAILNKKEQNKENYMFKQDICKTIADIRNILVAHGVITYSVAQNIVDDLFNITFFLVKEFEELNITISDDEKIKNIFEKDVFAIYKNNKELFLYSNTETEKQVDLYKECLNYETGKRKVIDNKVTLKTDTIYSVEQIETDLKKWVMN